MKLTTVSAGRASSMMKMPSVVILTPSRVDTKSVQPSEAENQHLAAVSMIHLTVYPSDFTILQLQKRRDPYGL